MPQFPCPVCGKMWPNTYGMRKCMQSEECIAKMLSEQKDTSSANRPAYKFDFAIAKAASIARGDWTRHGIDGAHHAPGGLGSLGVYLLNLKNDAGVIVMKQGSAESASEFYCSHLYPALGLRAAKMRVMPEAELATVVEQLASVSFTSPGAGDNLQSGGKQRGAVLMEFCPGRTFKDPAVAALLADPKAAPELLQQLGRLVAVDMLVNNYDRTPAVWDHEGNANNILVDSSADGNLTVYGIDQSTTKIVDEVHESTRIPEYLRKVQAAFEEAVAGNIDGKYTTKVADFLKKYLKCDITEEQRAAYHKGLLDAGVVIAGFHELSLVFEKTSTAFHEAGWGVSGLDSINIPFLERVAEAIADVVSKI